MRLFLLPLIAYVLVPLDHPVEPTERAMRIAFEQRLQVQVANVLDFLAESGGPEAVARVREAGMDRFAVRTFTKLDCTPDNDGFRCNFEVDMTLATGPFGRKISGRFAPGHDGHLSFVQDI